MALDLKPLDSASRLVVEARLRVAPGTGGRFQPTGFPDLGPALYKGFRSSSVIADTAPDRVNPTQTAADIITASPVDVLLVESVQSMANRLEDVCLAGEDYNSDCQGIPYVRVQDGNRNNGFLTSSVREPHRLASPYVLGAKVNNNQEYRKQLAEALQANKSRSLHIWRLVPEIFSRDPGCVLHGVFLEEIDGRIRLPRLVSAYIEAYSPMSANSGGVYRGEVTAKDNIPYSRQEFTSSDILASFILHLGTLAGYKLCEDQRRFLQAWALYKIDRFLRVPQRLRTACEFELVSITATLDGKPWSWPEPKPQPEKDDIAVALQSAKEKCFPAVTEGDEWVRRRVQVVTYRIDFSGDAPLPEGVTEEAFNLSGFEGRAIIKELTKGKGQRARKVKSLVLTGEWPDEDQEALLRQNPAAQEADESARELNPAHEVVKAAINKWNEDRRKKQKKISGAEDSEE